MHVFIYISVYIKLVSILTDLEVQKGFERIAEDLKDSGVTQ